MRFSEVLLESLRFGEFSGQEAWQISYGSTNADNPVGLVRLLDCTHRRIRAMTSKDRKRFLHQHSLSIAAIAVLVTWIVLYVFSDPSTHIGSFFGNAIADWTGVVVTVIATKYLYEKGSAESRRPPEELLDPLREWLRNHSLSIFLLLSGIAWVVVFALMNSESKWGQVVGNIVSEWTQLFGLVLLTKRLVERHSKESAR